ncbi:MAG: hypothetical protein IH897_07100 [Planctomycetes bacterium]|nr:hypothetical protein [Planctomycetota bacterium]
MDDHLCGVTEDVPEPYAGRFTKFAELSDAFCEAHLNAEYKQLCREMVAVVCQDGSSVLRGKPSGWAAGIVYALGRVNFLTDPNQTPHMAATEIAKGFGVSQATMLNKAKVIRQWLDLMPLHSDWCLPGGPPRHSAVSCASSRHHLQLRPRFKLGVIELSSYRLCRDLLLGRRPYD